MKRFTTITEFIPLCWEVSTENLVPVKNKVFKTRASVEKYCKTNGCMYVERKYIFYR